ncbi:hypothetical protein CALCODRAFT_482845 [Calocera cornea HHB12733]|uniref:DNA replication regulator SLD2 n=1 Tax=Calocera cornea HHB12733 TaxID=1353952 RepID=A0A165GBA8_9BASI|nr:hypothetical protein CALCODRAFT_482845 [Calocera cornea HHB12733]
MNGNDTAIDLDRLRAELKTWERDFKAKKGREPSRDDIKKAPDIDAKYKIYNKSRSKAGSASGTSAHGVSEKKSKAKGRSSSRPSPAASSATAVESVGNVEETFNPFRSPTKGGPSAGQSPVKRRLSIFTDEDPFAAGDEHDTPTSSLFAKLKSSSPANNAFGSPRKKPLFMGASAPPLPSTPSRSILKTPATTSAISDIQPEGVLSPSKYVSASSPTKLRALIQSSKAADTPRTKARKRLAGEEDFTPVKSDRRRRLSSLAAGERSSSEGLEKDEAIAAESMEVDEFGPTPKKAEVPRQFKPIFESPVKQDLKTKGFFSKRTVSFSAPSSSRESSAQPPEQPQPNTSHKRPASPEAAASKVSTSVKLIPPSPPAAGGSKAKPRKKAKKAKKQSKDAEEEDGSSSERENSIKQIPYSRWGGLQATRRRPNDPEDEDDEIWDFDVLRPAPALSQDPAIADEVEEELTVRLPTDMFDLLDLDSPAKPRREEEQLVKGIFEPRRKTSDRQVVFGAGEWEAEEEGVEDWEEEPDGWKGDAELDLDDF